MDALAILFVLFVGVCSIGALIIEAYSVASDAIKRVKRRK